MHVHHFTRHALAMAVAACLWMPQANAQQTGEQNSETKSDGPQRLDAIKVRAQKREEQLQDVPVVVTALSAERLQDSGVRDVKDLQVLVPGLTVTSTQSEAQTTARIRGIGTVGDNVGLESSVGIVIDGVYRPRNGVGFGDLGEIEQIEVLKGPQGTLFGKNTSAGVINITTREPSHTGGAFGELTVGNYGAIGLAGGFNLPIDDKAAFRMYVAKRKRDGFITVNTGNGQREDFNQDFGTVRAQLAFDASDSVKVRLIGDSTTRDENCCTAVTIVRGPTAAILNRLAPGGVAVSPTADPYARQAWSNRGTEQKIKDKGISAEVTWDMDALGGATFTSITGLRNWSSSNGLDFDFSTADLIYRNADENDNHSAFDTRSQEFRLAGSSDKFDWLVGAFYAREALDRNEGHRISTGYEPYLSVLLLSGINPALAASPTAPLFLSQASGRTFGTVFAGHGTADRYRQKSTTAALFTNNTWHATDALDLTFGVRYSRESKELWSHYTNPNGAPGCTAMRANPAQVVGALMGRGLTLAQASAAAPSMIGYACLPWTNAAFNDRMTNQKRDETEWSGTFKVAYRWNPSVMTYFSAARGHKGGGFNVDRVQSANGLSSGAAGIVPVSDTSFPAEFVNSFELGAKTTWMDGNLLLNAALFDQRYTDFQLNSFIGTSFVVRSIPKVTSRGVDAELLWQHGGFSVQSGLTYADTKYGKQALADADLRLLPGSTASFAPKWSATAALGYDMSMGSSLRGRFHLGAKYMSDYNTGSDLDPEKLQKAYTLVDARFGIGSNSRRWNVELWGQNLTNANYMQVAFDAPLQSGTWNAFLGTPRTYGVTLRLSH